MDVMTTRANIPLEISHMSRTEVRKAAKSIAVCAFSLASLARRFFASCESGHGRKARISRRPWRVIASTTTPSGQAGRLPPQVRREVRAARVRVATPRLPLLHRLQHLALRVPVTLRPLNSSSRSSRPTTSARSTTRRATAELMGALCATDAG